MAKGGRGRRHYAIHLDSKKRTKHENTVDYLIICGILLAPFGITMVAVGYTSSLPTIRPMTIIGPIVLGISAVCLITGVVTSRYMAKGGRGSGIHGARYRRRYDARHQVSEVKVSPKREAVSGIICGICLTFTGIGVTVVVVVYTWIIGPTFTTIIIISALIVLELGAISLITTVNSAIKHFCKSASAQPTNNIENQNGTQISVVSDHQVPRGTEIILQNPLAVDYTGTQQPPG